MSKDLRSFLERYQSAYPDEVWKIDDSISLEYEGTALALQLEKKQKFPVLFFQNMEGFPFPVVSNLFADRKRIAFMLGLEEQKLISDWPRMASRRIKPVLANNAPVKEVITSGSSVDLLRYPIPVHFESDAGRYISGGVTVSKDPDTGVGNLNFTRLQIKGPDLMGASLHSRGDLWDFQRRQEERGKPLEVAVVIGAHPTVCIAGATRLPIDEDELELAGGLLREPIPLVPAETLDLLVPANAEMVIEGYIEPDRREQEGPFGEYTGYSTDRSTRNVFRVTAITHRRDMIFHDIVPGASAEHLNLSKTSRVPQEFEMLKRVFPNVVAMNYPTSGTHFHCYLSMKKKMEGQPKQAMMFLFGLDMYLKWVVVVDEDIDVFNEQEVLWALATRFQADRDLFVVPDVACNILDPSSHDGMSAKLGMDATRPLDAGELKMEFSRDVIRIVEQKIKNFK